MGRGDHRALQVGDPKLADSARALFDIGENPLDFLMEDRLVDGPGYASFHKRIHPRTADDQCRFPQFFGRGRFEKSGSRLGNQLEPFVDVIQEHAPGQQVSYVAEHAGSHEDGQRQERNVLEQQRVAKFGARRPRRRPRVVHAFARLFAALCKHTHGRNSWKKPPWPPVHAWQMALALGPPAPQEQLAAEYRPEQAFACAGADSQGLNY